MERQPRNGERWLLFDVYADFLVRTVKYLLVRLK
jgi:hypothetical protein